MYFYLTRKKLEILFICAHTEPFKILQKLYSIGGIAQRYIWRRILCQCSST